MADPTPVEGAALTRRGKVQGLFLPVGLVLSAAIVTGSAACSGVWIGAKYFYGGLEARIQVNEGHIADFVKDQAAIERRVAVLETNASNMSARLDEVNRKLDQVINLLLSRPDGTRHP